MSEIVERLRSDHGPDLTGLMAEAADEIVRLRVENGRLKEALAHINNVMRHDVSNNVEEAMARFRKDVATVVREAFRGPQ